MTPPHPLLGKLFPQVSQPVIISAPMFTVANGKLASEVTKAGGIGTIPAGLDPSPESPHLGALDEQLTITRQLLGTPQQSTLPIGVGFITLLATPEAYRAKAIPLVVKHRPAFVWLFGSDPAEYAEFINLFSSAGRDWDLKVFVQVGNVEAARRVVQAGADIVVAQGSDAGGHHFAKSASVMTLVPEVKDMLRDEFPGRDVPVLAAGGVVDGRGVAAALALGADAVVMGTRFIPCPEADTDPCMRKAVLNTRDGGMTTTRSSMHDAIMGYPTWSSCYMGRAITHEGIIELEDGKPLQDVEASFKKGMEMGDESRLVTYSGAGIGLVQTSHPAAYIVKEVTAEALDILAKLKDFST